MKKWYIYNGDGMSKRNIANIAGNGLECEIVRYFEKDGNTYLIYSLNEMDEVGYVKLYASKIIDDHARIITSDEEWSFVKDIIKEIVRNNRDGELPGVKDLNENKLDSVILEDNRVFKLQGNLVNLLMENKIVEEEPEEIEEEIEEAEEIPDVEIKDDYETLYGEMITKNELLENRISVLEQELEEYKAKLDRINSILRSE